MTHVPPSRHAIPQRVVDRIFDRIEVRSGDDCWPWKLSIGSHGYGQVGWSLGGTRSAMTTAHRVAWIAVHGPIPDGMTVDHLCRNRACCNPAHLRLLTNLDNARDNGFAGRTHCPRGHEYTDENTLRRVRKSTGWTQRLCLTCYTPGGRRREAA